MCSCSQTVDFANNYAISNRVRKASSLTNHAQSRFGKLEVSVQSRTTLALVGIVNERRRGGGGGGGGGTGMMVRR